MTQPAAVHHAVGPSAAGSVMLDIGAGTGALVLFAPAHLDGAEIEISAAGESDARRTHSRVRQRGCGGSGASGGVPDAGRGGGSGGVPGAGRGGGSGGVPGAGRGGGSGGGPDAGRGGGIASYAAVYPGLAAGTYTIWLDAQTPAGTAVICGGQVTTWRWPAAAVLGSPASD